MKDYALVIEELKTKSEKPEKDGRYMVIYLSNNRYFVETALYRKGMWLCNEKELFLWGKLPELQVNTTE